MRGTVVGLIRIEVPCPHCGEKDLQLLRELVDNDSVVCRYCGTIIDISSEDWRALINEALDRYSKIMWR